MVPLNWDAKTWCWLKKIDAPNMIEINDVTHHQDFTQ